MANIFINYYLLKDSLHYISSNITDNLDLSNNNIFKYALFNNCSKFYKAFNPFAKDYYQINENITKQFETFIYECLNTAYLHNSNEEKFFCYMLFFNHIITDVLKPYISFFINKKRNTAYIEKMIDAYFFHKFECKHLTKINVSDYFHNSFQLSDADINLLKSPLKRVFGFFCPKNYFDNCYKNLKLYFNYLFRSKTGIKILFYYSYDFLLNHRKNKLKAKNFLYCKKIDTKILNLAKDKYCDNKKYNLEELYSVILGELKKVSTILNDYFNYNQNTKNLDLYFRKIKQNNPID